MILVTGSKGQLGRALIRLLEKEGRACRGYDLDEVDIANFQQVLELVEAVRPELVINAAAYTDVDGAEKDWKTACRVNGLAVRNLAIACADRNIPLVHVGTDFVFDGNASEPYRIVDQPHPINMYGKSKLLGENFLSSMTNKYYLVRTSWVFGEGNSNFLKKLLGWSSNKDVLKVVEDQVASPTSAWDLAAALVKLAGTGAYGLYHFRNIGHCSRYQWAEFALRKKGWKGRVEPVTTDMFPAPAKRPSYSVLDLFPFDEMNLVTIPTWQDATSKWLEEFA
ncbi:MAG: dTDP-4-dehydrorhamnose reductase [Phycisphaerae bacterium]